jgi:hypothetical protein
MNKTWLLLGVFGVALVVNPYLACKSTDDDEFEYTEAEMKQAVLGTWEGTAELEGESVAFSLVLEQASDKSKTQSVSAPGVKPQCSSRSFVKPAAACVSMSEMPLTGTITSQNPELNGVLDGGAHAYLSLDSISLDLVLESGKTLSGALRDDALSEGSIRASSGDVGRFSLARP